LKFGRGKERLYEYLKADQYQREATKTSRSSDQVIAFVASFVPKSGFPLMATLMLMVMMAVIMAMLMGVFLVPMLVIVTIMTMAHRLMVMLMVMLLFVMATHFIFTSFIRDF
jgi:hypothetical protein